MTDRLIPLRKNRLFSQGLIAPLLLFSVAFHALILLSPMPVGPEPDSQPEEDAPKEEPVVDILSISRPQDALPESPATPETPPPAQAPPSPAAVPPNPTQLPLPQEKSPAAAVTVEEPLEETPPDSSTAPAFNPQESQQQFTANLGNLGVADYTDQLGLPTRELFRNPDGVNTFLANASSRPSALPGTQARWLDKEPDTVLRDNLVKVYEAAGVTFAELPPYGGERFFQAMTPEGQPFLYISLVQLRGSTLMVVWNSPPPGASL